MSVPTREARDAYWRTQPYKEHLKPWQYVTLVATITLALIGMIVAIVADDADAQVDPIPEPPSLRDEPDQRKVEHHISPETCTVVLQAEGNICAESGERFFCPAGLSLSAVHRTDADLSYEDSIKPNPPATRDSHCTFYRYEATYPVDAADPNRPVVTCVERFVNGQVNTGPCQTVAFRPLPVPTVTVQPTPAPTATVAPTPTSAPADPPTPAFTG